MEAIVYLALSNSVGQIGYFKDSDYQTALSLLNLHRTYIQLPHRCSAPWSWHNRPSRGTPPEKNNTHVRFADSDDDDVLREEKLLLLRYHIFNNWAWLE